MTEAEMADYLATVVAVLRMHRPELVTRRDGRWSGPGWIPEAPVGLWFRGPLLVCVSPWSAFGEPWGIDVPIERMWLHASASHPARDPTYAELTDVRDRFFRPADTVVHVWPPRTEHYSHHPHCIHLWTPLDGSRPIPDLRAGGGGV